MLTIQRDPFELTFIDPEADRHLLGDRFCWGGLLWQVRDANGRDLLAGPEYPEPEPSPFNAQGLPEVFRSWDKRTNSRLNFDAAGRGLVIGVGLVHVTEGAKLAVDRPCEWQVSQTDTDIIWRTTDQHADFGYELERRWTTGGPSGRTLTSTNRTTSTGSATLDVHWYPHPFFPLTDGGASFTVTPDVTMEPKTGGYRRTDRTWQTTDACSNPNGCFEWLLADYTDQLQWTVNHPVCGSVTVDGYFTTAYMPVWCNRNTISLEPHVLHALSKGHAAEWSIAYRFG